MRIAFLGPAGTYGEQAALRLAALEGIMEPDLQPQVGIRAVVQALASGLCDAAVVPVENSVEGGVTACLDALWEHPELAVGRALVLPIRHALLGSGPLEGISEVLSHPQALAQCQGWLSQHLPNVERRAVSSNAEGARLAATHPTWAGIASERAASQFSLHIVAHAIQDEAYNRTRFSVICLPQTLATPPASGKDCTSLVVSVPNRPGAVHDLLVPLKRHGVSMTRFESRPAKSGQWEYYFYIDIAGHPDQPHVAAALKELQSLCAFYKVLGAYPVSE